ncbi:FGGY family carbohydrate kinase [Subtercola endophyticus]|uniref:FGGY family carbohydrate kinase n=1 Tax=Subtercola endophyticus TaxID=2895559 RepID=UPI001E58364E|nr:FGGY family carbohydrate kinase [Subtercola endophyticus]UFS57917.1 xylulose kinase [Subtercola endophyticus]
MFVAGIDSSTQSCKVVVRDATTGALVRQGKAGHPEGTEVDPEAWWVALKTAIADAGGFGDVSAVAIGGQQHGMVVLDAEGRVIRDALLWNDTRSAAAASALIAEVGADGPDGFAARTGSLPVASFTATKLRWLRDAEPANAARVAAVALPHDWLTWRLLGYGPADESPLGPVLDALTTDRSDASGTSYWSPAANAYDFALFEQAFGRPAVEALGAAEAAVEAHADSALEAEQERIVDAAVAGLVNEALGESDSTASSDHSTDGATAYGATVDGSLGDDSVQPGFGSFGADPATGEPELESVGQAAAAELLPPVILPRVVQTGEVAGVTVDHPGDAVLGTGVTTPAAEFAAPIIPAGILVGAGAGDNAGAALGLNATAGDVVISIGTSGTAFAVTEHPVADVTGTVAGFADAAGAFLPLVATLNAARVLASISTLLGVDYDQFAALALDAEPGSGGLVLVPYFEGERTPNLPDATATLAGLTLGSTTRENLARAAIEGMLCALADGVAAIRSLGVDARRILLVGGAAQNAAVQAVASQVFDVAVSVPTPGEYVADGAARQAAWTLTGTRPTWPVSFVAELPVATVPAITAQYRRAQQLGSLPR